MHPGGSRKPQIKYEHAPAWGRPAFRDPGTGPVVGRPDSGYDPFNLQFAGQIIFDIPKEHKNGKHLSQKTKASGRAAWLADAVYGLSLHWVAQSVPRHGDRPLPVTEAVDKFDVPLLVQQCVEAGAGWLLFTISHAKQHLLFPSKIMDRVLPGRTCERDLMAEIIDALAAKNIPVIFYYPNIADNFDPDWQRASGWLYDPASYTALQYDLVTEIGERYGPKLAGWWIDNCYDPKICLWKPWHVKSPSINKHADLYDFERYANALRAGNPDRAVAFNFAGTDAWKSELGKGIVDYAAGESNHLDRLPYGQLSGEGDSQWHSFVWMDEFWGHWAAGEIPPPRYETGLVISYIEYVKKHGGAFSYNAAAYQDELIPETTMEQLRKIKTQIRKGSSVSDQIKG